MASKISVDWPWDQDKQEGEWQCYRWEVIPGKRNLPDGGWCYGSLQTDLKLLEYLLCKSIVISCN